MMNINFGSSSCLIVIKGLCIVFKLTVLTRLRESVPALGAHLAVGVTDHCSCGTSVVRPVSQEFLIEAIVFVCVCTCMRACVCV